MRIATLILHIRWRLAWHGVANHADSCRLRTGCARGIAAVGRPSAKYHNELRDPLGSGDSLDARFMDAHCRDLSGPG